MTAFQLLTEDQEETDRLWNADGQDRHRCHRGGAAWPVAGRGLKPARQALCRMA